MMMQLTYTSTPLGSLSLFNTIKQTNYSS
uniref:Uncharacterized protein n=1 Tax=Rhizophora mucronata TaxID=61149 RepID=A0A2P2PFX5_RHIMU